MRSARAFVLAVMSLAGSAALPTAVLAHNCSPNNRADCERTAGYNATVSTVSGLGVFGGLVLGGFLSGDDNESDDNVDDESPSEPR